MKNSVKIGLSDHFTYKKLIKYVLPAIIMMVCTSVYGIVDGLFVSNFVGKTPFAAVNLVMPVLMIFGAFGFMMGTGGSAIVAKTMGEGDGKKANEYFSFLVYFTVGAGFVLMIAGEIFLPNIVQSLGAGGETARLCVSYGRIYMLALPAFMLQYVFQAFFSAAEKPAYGLAVTVLAGLTNVALDYIFIAVFNLGIEGAAGATAISQCVGGVVPLIYFFRKNSSKLRLGKTHFNGRVLAKACTNGSSEMATNISMSVVNMLYNIQLIKIAGENGVAAFGVIMYVSFIFAAIFIGYSIGASPVVSYNYGAGNNRELKNVFKKSVTIVFGIGIAMLAGAELLSQPLTYIFVGYDPELALLTCGAFRLYAISFVIMGMNIFTSAFFTALGNGLISATISFLRTLVFQIVAIFTLPAILGIDGIWLAVVFAEAMAVIVSITFLKKNGKKYNYV